MSFLEFNAGMAEKLDARQNTRVDAPDGFEISMRYDPAGVSPAHARGNAVGCGAILASVTPHYV